MITYNHEKYISQALESIINQNISFQLEIIVSDDCSTDNTQEIVEGYAFQDNRIKFKRNAENLGIIKNFIKAISFCKGSYIALLEGDDYWISNIKLENQIDFLEKNREYSFVFHNAKIIYGTNNSYIKNFADLQEKEYNGAEILNQWLVPTGSVVFRNEITFPDFSYRCIHGDILLFLLLLEKGKSFCIDQFWSIYRKNEGGVTSNYKSIPYLKTVYEQHVIMQKYFRKYVNEFNKQKIYWLKSLLKQQLIQRKYMSLIKYLFIYINIRINLLN